MADKREIAGQRVVVCHEIQVGLVEDDGGCRGILSILTTEGSLDISLDRATADSIMDAIAAIRPKIAR
ncbi:hypothetical protein ACVDG8_029350 [Mesorhizobium sp. ORM8.1]